MSEQIKTARIYFQNGGYVDIDYNSLIEVGDRLFLYNGSQQVAIVFINHIACIIRDVNDKKGNN